MSVENQMSNKVALVTGGGSGLGAAICQTLASSGVKTIVADIHLHKAKEIASRIESQGGKAMAVELDVTNYEAIPAKLKEIVNQYGRLDAAGPPPAPPGWVSRLPAAGRPGVTGTG